MDIISILYECGLPRLKPSGSKWNARCVVCGDSQKSSKKARFWVFQNKKHIGTYHCHCFNCGYSMSLKLFIKQYFPDVFKRHFSYYKSQTSDKDATKKLIYTPDVENKIQVKQKDTTFTKLSKLENSHDANQYINKRKIPVKWRKYLLFADNFKESVNKIIPNKFANTKSKDPRLVIPFYTIDKKIFAVAGRALADQKPRYITIKFDEDHPKIFGLERANFDKRMLVFEGQIDSLFMPNSLALGGSISNVKKLLDYGTKKNFVLVPDLEPRNKEICKFIEHAISLNFPISLLPHTLKKFGKDINDILLNSNLTPRRIYDIIQENVTLGIASKLKFKIWRKIKWH